MQITIATTVLYHHQWGICLFDLRGKPFTIAEQ
ncbi:hypothetical protein T4B_7605 [Trichinella pseudospiralis]|uniref:Uncharacterized protein n=1 Tax=Trichinella pseudospiralis TaxID=6337 RepID=A0A0V1GA47_TRIPS|nr:hypothetical protein T4B_7605 [Trichinella pseudospiralis]